MKKTEFNRLLKPITTARRLDPEKAQALDNATKERLVAHIVRQRQPVVVNLIPENHPFVGFATMRDWLTAMGYHYTTSSDRYTFLHTSAHTFPKPGLPATGVTTATPPPPKPKPAVPVVRTGMSTPWGVADQAYVYLEGIGRVCTPSHGGIKLSPARNALIPEPLRAENGWYEEDCEWATPFYFFAEELIAANPGNPHLKPDLKEEAARTLKAWSPHEFTAATGIAVALEESHVLREEAFYTRHAQDWITIAAWGDWQGGVPDGMVGVCALQGGRSRTGLVQDRGPERWFLVPAAEYAKRDIGFVIDLARHQQVDDFSKLPRKEPQQLAA